MGGPTIESAAKRNREQKATIRSFGHRWPMHEEQNIRSIGVPNGIAPHRDALIVAQQRPDRPQKPPTEETWALRFPSNPTPGTPQSRAHPAPRHDSIGSTMGIHRRPHDSVEDSSEIRLRFIDAFDYAEPYHANNSPPK